MRRSLALAMMLLTSLTVGPARGNIQRFESASAWFEDGQRWSYLNVVPDGDEFTACAYVWSGERIHSGCGPIDYAPAPTQTSATVRGSIPGNFCDDTSCTTWDLTIDVMLDTDGISYASLDYQVPSIRVTAHYARDAVANGTISSPVVLRPDTTMGRGSIRSSLYAYVGSVTANTSDGFDVQFPGPSSGVSFYPGNESACAYVYRADTYDRGCGPLDVEFDELLDKGKAQGMIRSQVCEYEYLNCSPSTITVDLVFEATQPGHVDGTTTIYRASATQLTWRRNAHANGVISSAAMPIGSRMGSGSLMRSILASAYLDGPPEP